MPTVPGLGCCCQLRRAGGLLRLPSLLARTGKLDRYFLSYSTTLIVLSAAGDGDGFQLRGTLVRFLYPLPPHSLPLCSCRCNVG